MNNYMDTAGSYSGIGSNKLLGKSFLWMFIGMLISGGLAWFTYASGLWIRVYYTGMFSVLLIVELAAVMVFSFMFRRLPAAVVTLLYVIYASITGIVFSCIFVLYDLGSIVMLFAVAAVAFGALGLIGYNSKSDFTGWRPYLMVFLIAFIVLELFNAFILKSTFTQMLVDAGVLTLFLAITIYDVNRLKNTQNYGYYDVSKAHIYFAMQLYLDFINIFIRMLALFGKKK